MTREHELSFDCHSFRRFFFTTGLLYKLIKQCEIMWDGLFPLRRVSWTGWRRSFYFDKCYEQRKSELVAPQLACFPCHHWNKLAILSQVKTGSNLQQQHPHSCYKHNYKHLHFFEPSMITKLALEALKDRLMTENVAEEIAERLCESVTASEEKPDDNTYSSVNSAISIEGSTLTSQVSTSSCQLRKNSLPQITSSILLELPFHFQKISRG